MTSTQNNSENNSENKLHEHVQNRVGDVEGRAGAAAGGIDSRSLWWREAEHCPHAPDEEACLCWAETGWDFGPHGVFGAVVDAGGTRYVTDARLLIREDRLSGWPAEGDPDYPYPTDLNQVPVVVRRVVDMLAAPEAGAPVTREFDPALLDPITAAGYEVRPLAYERGVHAVVDPRGLRVGVLMPLLTPRRRRPGRTR